jgi:hypothetical protein
MPRHFGGKVVSMDQRSDNFPLVLLGGILALFLLQHTIFDIFFEEYIKLHLEAYVGLTVAEMIERFGSVALPALASIAIVWFLHHYIYRELRKEFATQTKVAPPRPTFFDPARMPPRDVKLADVIWRVALGSWGERKSAPPMDNELDRACHQIRQMAFDGKLPIWAIRERSDLFEIVPQEFWSDRAIVSAYSAASVTTNDLFIEVMRPLKIGEMRGGRTKEWENFMTSKSIVDKLWPPKEAVLLAASDGIP